MDTFWNKKRRKKGKEAYNGRTIKNRIIRDMKTLFETKNEKGERKKKKQNEKVIKDKIIRNIRILF